MTTPATRGDALADAVQAYCAARNEVDHAETADQEREAKLAAAKAREAMFALATYRASQVEGERVWCFAPGSGSFVWHGDYDRTVEPIQEPTP